MEMQVRINSPDTYIYEMVLQKIGNVSILINFILIKVSKNTKIFKIMIGD
ncbi:hypothetical protein MHK_003371 [Candidatus Magnetomorum sp. HK-1]|nr:hypothetical protein MHK_003371 [Candidatus Magnetomorum sp. HK-1]